MEHSAQLSLLASKGRRISENSLNSIVLEHQSPSAAVMAIPIPRMASNTVLIVASMFAACLAAIALIKVDSVVTAVGHVVSKVPTIVVQPLETSVVRSIKVQEGQHVKSGEVLAELDQTFAAADVDALKAQSSSLQAEVLRLEAELAGRSPGISEGASSTLQGQIYARREMERNLKMESYRQKIEGLTVTATNASADVKLLQARLDVAQEVETMRKDLNALQVGSRLNLLTATDIRLELERNVANATKTIDTAKSDLAAMVAERDAYNQNWLAQTAQSLSEQSGKLIDSQEALKKALLRRQLVELRADRDATVLTVSKVSVGSVLQSGERLLTMVPSEAPLEIEADISGRDDGFVRAGDPVAVKFDAFPFTRHGIGMGAIRVVSADSFSANDQDQRLMDTGSRNLGDKFYKARISIDRFDLHDVPDDFHLVPGMPVTVDVGIGRHSILNYFLQRILTAPMEGMREP
jgi:hemolysin D